MAYRKSDNGAVTIFKITFAIVFLSILGVFLKCGNSTRTSQAKSTLQQPTKQDLSPIDPYLKINGNELIFRTKDKTWHQLKNFKIHVNPQKLTEADVLNGISEKLYVQITSTSRRSTDKEGNWKEWTPGRTIIVLGVVAGADLTFTLTTKKGITGVEGHTNLIQIN